LQLRLGSGAGAEASLRVKGTGVNNVTEASLFINNLELVRFGAVYRLMGPPQGYLTPTVNVPVIVADAAAASAIFYEPFIGNLVPVIMGGVYIQRIFSSMTLTLNNPNHVADTLYDVFIDDDAGTLRIGTGPAWTNSGAGASARGAGAGTTELFRLGAHLVNNVAVTARNGAATYTIPAKVGTYVGTILIDATAGSVTCHRSYGQTRRWGVWNYYNRQPLYLKGGDPNASWAYALTTIRASRGDSTNMLKVLSGLDISPFDFTFLQSVEVPVNASPGSIRALNGIGLNSTTVASGKSGSCGLVNQSASSMVPYGEVTAEFLQVPMLGVNNIHALERASNLGGVSNITWQGAEAAMVLSAKWLG